MYCANSGDILLFVNYNDNYRFEKNRRMRSTHGSLLPSDSYVPLIFATPYNPKLIKSIGVSGILKNFLIVKLDPFLAISVP